MKREEDSLTWSFLTNHAAVLLCISHEPRIRLRDIGDAVGVTARAAFRIVGDLADAGYQQSPTTTGKKETPEKLGPFVAAAQPRAASSRYSPLRSACASPIRFPSLS
jgi:hypothetical protein